MATLLDNRPSASHFAKDQNAASVSRTRSLSPSQERKPKRTIDETSTSDDGAIPSKKARVDSPTEQTITTPTTQTALLVTTGRKYRLETSFPIPQELGKDEVMIRSRAVGLNHIDWKSVEWNFCLPELPWITGREMAGVVERVGAEVSNVKAGDAVWTCELFDAKSMRRSANT